MQLDRVEELFTATAADPLQGRYDPRSGIEYLLDNVEPIDQPLHIDIAVGEGEVGNQNVRIGEALAGYAAVRTERLALERARIRRLGLKELAFGVGFLAFCLVASTLLAGFQLGPEWFRHLVVEGLVIIGWISLWHPVDMLFFERLPLIREQRILKRLSDAQVTVRRADSTVR